MRVAPRSARPLLVAMLVAGGLAGCVRRTVEITSTPPGALVFLNDREIGRTPTTAEITYYGEYDVQLRLDGHAPLDTAAKAVAPVWDWIGPDLVAEVIPVNFTSRNRWHFELTPQRNEPEAVLLRARTLRATLAGDEVAAPTTPAQTMRELREVMREQDDPAAPLAP